MFSYCFLFLSWFLLVLFRMLANILPISTSISENNCLLSLVLVLVLVLSALLVAVAVAVAGAVTLAVQ